MLLPLQGEWIFPMTIPQGVALGYVLLGFQPVLLIIIPNLSLERFTLSIHPQLIACFSILLLGHSQCMYHSLGAIPNPCHAA